MFSKIVFVNFGKFKSNELEKVFLEYVKRISYYVKTEVKYLKIQDDTPSGFNKIKDKVLSVLNNKKILLLSLKGEKITNSKLSQFINSGNDELYIVVGSSWGIPKYIEEGLTCFSISISDLTLPHELVRAIISEQIYRSFTIIKGEKYHK
jgi:23S rRNA (pseudouridine1915-N3)-methyltransferase